MINQLFSLFLAGSLVIPGGPRSAIFQTPSTIKTDTALYIPLGGNTWASGNHANGQTMVNGKGIVNWKDAQQQFSTWFRITKPGTIVLKLQATTTTASKVKVTIGKLSREISITPGTEQWIKAGEWTVKDTGYIKVLLAGVSKTGDEFARIAQYEISGSAINAQTAFVKNNEGNFFYWGRRGPSVHLNFPFADDIQAQWFYNEVTVPEGQDVIGSYYMANGFGEGYFGIQVNSATERRILFSVWSPYSTDKPSEIPEDQRIQMLKKGADVHAGEFGNEGSGGQSYLRYNWKAGVAYKFLLGGIPDGNGNTTYTAYFFDPAKRSWMLIASFKRPKTNTWLKRFHSFLENFNPDQGEITRRVQFGNQWVCDSKGQWTELTKATFTYDNTAAKGYRMDYAGGESNGSFFLKNCGFFNEHTPYRSTFVRPAQGKQPVIDFTTLP